MVIEDAAAARQYAIDSHYFSTYCIHGDCGSCRLTCKTCNAPCRCSCHTPEANDDGT